MLTMLLLVFDDSTGAVGYRGLVGQQIPVTVVAPDRVWDGVVAMGGRRRHVSVRGKLQARCAGIEYKESLSK